MLCLFSQRLMMEIMPDENLYYIQQGLTKMKETVNDLTTQLKGWVGHIWQ